MTYTQRLSAFCNLGRLLTTPDEELKQLIETACYYNAWFTPESTENSINSIAEMLNEDDLKKWFEIEKEAVSTQNNKIVGLVLAGNIPLVGLHDILCVLASGNKVLIKLSSQDNKLIPYLLQKLIEIEPKFESKIVYTERLENFDMIIATGSNNTSRYFEYYFKNVPHIIRKNRNSIAVLSGNESAEQLSNLGNDIFNYYGLGCRNVSKIYIPKEFNLVTFFEAIEHFQPIINHHKYNNNYDYNKSIFLVNGAEHLDNGFLLVKEDKQLTSPLATLYYERYSTINDLLIDLSDKTSQIQCISTQMELNTKQQVKLGQTQSPKLWDYADDINTMQWLAKANE